MIKNQTLEKVGIQLRESPVNSSDVSIINEMGEYSRVLLAGNPVFRKRFIQLALNEAVMSNFEQQDTVDTDEEAGRCVTQQKVAQLILTVDRARGPIQCCRDIFN